VRPVAQSVSSNQIIGGRPGRSLATAAGAAGGANATAPGGRAARADRPERDELYEWNKQDYDTFKEYEQKTDRVIPVVILEPVG